MQPQTVLAINRIFWVSWRDVILGICVRGHTFFYFLLMFAYRERFVSVHTNLKDDISSVFRKLPWHWEARLKLLMRDLRHILRFPFAKKLPTGKRSN